PFPNSPGSAPSVQVPPFQSIGRGFFTEPDPDNPGQVITTLRGYVLAWAIGQFPDGNGGLRINEIHWNHLSGMATILNYADASAWEYNAWAFQAVADLAPGTELPGAAGVLNLDGVDYDWAPDVLLFDFYASDARLTSDRDPSKPWPTFTVDTDLTLWPAIKDLRR
ncbi:MAG: hypothetical protein J5J06_17830, partial [Phycisphaerae bacterium]|nr:hypothetical protein [Phycisphaerae bacterium]